MMPLDAETSHSSSRVWPTPWNGTTARVTAFPSSCRAADEPTLFFQELSNIELRSFSVEKLFDGGSSIAAWISISWRWKPSGREFSDRFAVHLWEFDAAGKVRRFVHIEDTHAMWLATVPRD